MATQQTDADDRELDAFADAEDDTAGQPMEVPIGIVLARILVVTGMSFSAAVAIFCAVGAIWEIAALAVLATVFFVLLMFGVERFAER